MWYCWIISFLLLNLSVSASLPPEITKIIQHELPGAQIRIDNVIESKQGQWILITPIKEINLNNDDSTELTLISKTDDKDFLFSNGWIYTKIKNNSIKSFDFYPKLFQEFLLRSKIYQEFIVPKGFCLPRDLAFLAGRLPLELSAIELASDRDKLYRIRVAEAKTSEPIKFITYSYNSGQIQNILIDQNVLSEPNQLSKAETSLLQEVNKNFQYISKIHSYEDGIYLGDLITGKIFVIKKERFEYDATQPMNTMTEGNYQLKLITSLNNLQLNNGIKDFAFNKNKSIAYILTEGKSKLAVINLTNQKLIKQIDLPLLADGLQVLSRSNEEPDKLVFFSRAASKIFFVNTFDLRISDQVDLKHFDENYNYIPYTVFAGIDYIYVGVEKVNKKLSTEKSGVLLAFDTITQSFYKDLYLNFIPQNILQIDTKGNEQEPQGPKLIVLGKDNDSGQIAKIDSKNLTLLGSVTLDKDLATPLNLKPILKNTLLAIPNADTNILGLVDVETLKIIKKIDIKNPINLIEVIND